MLSEVRWIRLLLAVALCCGTLVVAACGEDEEEAAAGAAPAAQADAAGGDCAGAARSELATFQEEIPLKVPDQPLDTNRLRGKSLFFVSVINNEFSLEVIKGYEQAVEAMGARATIYDAKGQASRFGTGVAQAVSQNADGIVLFGIAPAVVAKQIADAQEKGIAVIDVYNGQPDAPLPEGISQHVSADYERSSQALANWMLADSGCKANAALFQTPVLSLYQPLTTEAPKVFERCGGACSFEVQEADLATFATKLGPQVSSFVRANPDTNYVQVAFDSMITFVEPALAQSGSDVKLLGHDGIPSVLEAIRKDSGPTKATMAFPPEAWIGWNIADTVARQVAEAEPVDATIPTRLVDKSNVGTSNEEIFPAYRGFQEAWQASWSGGA
jgi:ribose transport system substrate-binding protein